MEKIIQQQQNVLLHDYVSTNTYAVCILFALLSRALALLAAVHNTHTLTHTHIQIASDS